VAHFLLTLELLPALNPERATIVAVSSNGHYLSLASEEDTFGFSDETSYNRVIQYGRAKLANILFAQELQ
jgi:NAD(P)-dependent dehydrogenase (short-subunit alcohol dehydrogenase family)